MTIKSFQNSNGKKSNKGMLKYKSSKKNINQSFQTTKEQFSIKNHSNNKFKILRLFKENFKFRNTRNFDNFNYKSITISYKNNQYFVTFNSEIELENKLKLEKLTKISKNNIQKLKPIGLDLNNNSIDLGFQTKTNENKLIDNHISFKNNMKIDNKIKQNKKKLEYLQQKQSNRIDKLKSGKKFNKGEKLYQFLPKNFFKTQKKINKIFTKNTNLKLHNLHKIANNIIKTIKDNNRNLLIVEDLNIKSMTKKSKGKEKSNIAKVIGKHNEKEMKKNILQSSFGLLLQILEYKCAENEIYFKRI